MLMPAPGPSGWRHWRRDPGESGVVESESLASHIPLIRSGPANGETCDGCEEPATRVQTLMETLDPMGRKVKFHVACFHVWDVERHRYGQ